MSETSLRNRWNYISKHSLYNTVWKEEQSRLQNLPKKNKRKKNLVVCLRAKWFICNTISKIFMVIPWWMSTKYETLCLVTSSFTVWGFCNFSVELTRPKMCSPGPPGPWAALVQTTSEDGSGMESFAGLEEQSQGKGQSVNSEARISPCSWCGHTAQNISIDGRKGWFSCSGLPACAVFALFHIVLIQVTVWKTYYSKLLHWKIVILISKFL